MMHPELIGQRFGILTVERYLGVNVYGQALWQCQCECGNERVTSTAFLRNGRVQDCGCRRPGNLIGRQYGHLKVLERVESIRVQRVYRCECECGKIITVAGRILEKGKVEDCGCISHRGEIRSYYKKAYNALIAAKKAVKTGDIKMYEGWKKSSRAFCEYVSGLEHYGEKGYMLTRKDKNQGYEPGNLQYMTPREITTRYFNEKNKKQS